MSEQGTPIPGEEAAGASLSPQKSEEALVERARNKGWRPLEEWEGEPDDWVDAKEFVGRQKLFDRIDELKGTLVKQRQEMQSDMRLVLQNMAKIREQEYKKARADLEAAREVALENDDARAAVKVSKEIETLEKERAQEEEATKKVAQSTGPTPEFVQWQNENQWFVTDSEMREDALSIGVGYAAGNPNRSQAEVLEYVSKRIKRMYPEKFSTGKKPAAAAVEGAGVPSGKQVDNNNRKGRISIEDLPEEHRVVARTIIKSGALKAQAAKNNRTEVEEYLAQYQENK